MWKDKVLVWEETDHSWNDFGEITTINNTEDDLYVQAVVIWKKTSLGEFIENAINAIESMNRFLEDKNILSGVMLAITTANLIPFHMKIVKDDDVANKFLSLIHRDESKQYILKEELKNSEFGKIDSLQILISNLIDNKILKDLEDKYIINGKVLNGAHLLE